MGIETSSFYLSWQFMLFYFFLFMWFIYAITTRWASRICLDVFSRIVGLVAFPYNRGFRQLFAADFDLRDPPSSKKESKYLITGEEESMVEIDVQSNEMSKMVSFSIDQFLIRNKKIPYEVSRSTSNEVAQRLKYYVHEYQDEMIDPNACFKMINVDYISDMEYWLTLMKPIILYTFVPENAGGELSDGTFSCIDDVFTIVNSNGSSFSHSVWDYGYEYMTIETCWGVLICPIDQLRIPHEPHYRIICIVPAGFVPVPFSMMVKRRRIERLKVSFGCSNIVRAVDSSGREYVSLTTPGCSMDAIISSDIFDVIKMKHMEYKNSSIYNRIKTFLRKEGIERDHVFAPLILDILNSPGFLNTRLTRTLCCEEVKFLVPRPRPKKKIAESQTDDIDIKSVMTSLNKNLNKKSQHDVSKNKSEDKLNKKPPKKKKKDQLGIFD